MSMVNSGSVSGLGAKNPNMMRDPGFFFFGDDVQKTIRAKFVAEYFTPLIETYFSGKLMVGVEAFQYHLIECTQNADLLEVGVFIDPIKVGVHPANRNRAGLITADVHDLLEILAQQGIIIPRLDLLATKVPNSEEGRSWQKFNKTMTASSDGYLAPWNQSLPEYVTARGGHTTGAARCMKMGTKSSKAQLCVNGHISASKIIEQQPTMAMIMDSRGLPYSVIDHDLVELCPRLMETLCKTGNANHGTHRTETALQACKGMHQTIKENPTMQKEEIIKLACMDKLPGYEHDAECFYEFTIKWAGSKNDPWILDQLEAYERLLGNKRKMNPQDLLRFSTIALPDAQEYIIGLLKAMLNAPPEFYADGYATVFTPGDISSLVSPTSEARKLAKESTVLWKKAKDVLKAYGSNLPELEAVKLVSELQIKSCMHVHNKVCRSRTTFKSLQHIASHFYAQAKKADDKLPKWSVIESFHEKGLALDTTDKKASGSQVRELRPDGKVTVEELERAGFEEGTMVRERSDDSDNASWYNVGSLKGDIITLTDAECTGAQLIVDWVPKKTAEIEVSPVVFPPTYFFSPLQM